MTATVVEQAVGKVRFCVDDVEPAQQRLAVRKAKLRLKELFAEELLAFSHVDRDLIFPGHRYHTHPLAHAVHAAFNDHRPLLLTPDIVWITLAQGLAQHINNHAATLRSRFVSHQGRESLVVKTLAIPNSLQQWSALIQQWTLLIRDRVGADVYRLFECNFSTTTPITHTTSHVVMMDAFQKYFDYELAGICGIPEITLEGTVEDWTSIYNRVQLMAQYDLGWWTNRLLPICQELIKTASGQPSQEFWQAIYKPKAVYGGNVITGWLADLFPYLQHNATQVPSVKNPILSIDRGNIRVQDGISFGSLPLGLSEVPIKVKTQNAENYGLSLVAGFIGVSQAEDGTLCPEIGWAVLEKEDDRLSEALLAKIQRDHITQPPINWQDFNRRSLLGSPPKQLIQLLSWFDGATLYANTNHSWEIASDAFASTRQYIISRELSTRLNQGYVDHFIELADGRCITYAKNWLILGRPVELANPRSRGFSYDLEDCVIIAESFADLFERIFAAEGRYYFDDPDFIPICE